jgi:hypothetical protein
MHIVPAVLLLVAAGISTASAQAPSASAKESSSNFSLDHGHSSDSAADSKAAAAAARARAAAIAAGGPLSPSQSTDFHVNGGGVIRLAPPLTPEQEKAEAEGRAAWQARCRPTVIEDHEGLRRTRYAEPDCDLSRFNTAGGQSAR